MYSLRMRSSIRCTFFRPKALARRTTSSVICGPSSFWSAEGPLTLLNRLIRMLPSSLGLRAMSINLPIRLVVSSALRLRRIRFCIPVIFIRRMPAASSSLLICALVSLAAATLLTVALFTGGAEEAPVKVSTTIMFWSSANGSATYGGVCSRSASYIRRRSFTSRASTSPAVR